MTRILGIDPGSIITGYGIIDSEGNHTRYVTHGCIRVNCDALPDKLRHIFDQITLLAGEFQPVELAIEKVFMHKNADSALKLGQVRGVAMLAASSAGLEVAEYSPLSIKSAVVGYGRAEKQQVQHMVTRLLNLAEVPEPADAADALAIAICHLHTSATLERQRAVAT